MRLYAKSAVGGLTGGVAALFNATMKRLHPDSELIESLGGPAQVARLLGFDVFGTQRVFNWTRRGIPAYIKLEHPGLFLRDLLKANSRRKVADQA